MPWVVREAVRDINRAVARRWHAIDPLLPDPSTLPAGCGGTQPSLSPEFLAWQSLVLANQSTAAAPSLLVASTAMRNSTRLAVITATRSPVPTPRAARWRAKALLAPSMSANDQRSSPLRTASRSPNREAARRRASCIRAAAIGNILLHFEIDRQQ